MKKSLILFILLGFGLTMFPIPALKKVLIIKQSDGTFLDVVLCGDEYSHFFMTLDSIPVFETSLGFCYGSLKYDSILISRELAHNRLERTDREKKYFDSKDAIKNFLMRKHDDRQDNENLRRIKMSMQSRSLGVPKTFVGEKKGLVILVNFANLSMASSDAHGEFDALFNKEGYSKMVVSVRYMIIFMIKVMVNSISHLI